MKYVLDVHVHTVSSGHAYSTVMDYVREAQLKGLEMIGLSDHGPEMPGASHIFHIGNQRVIPSIVDGIRVLKGVEANIMDINGRIDIHQRYLEELDFVIASIHDACVQPGTMVENTKMMIETMKNQPLVDIIGHAGNPKVEIDLKEFVLAAGEYNKIIEINNSSFTSISRKGSTSRCAEIARYAKEFGVKVIAGSDSHFHTTLGVLDTAQAMIEDAGITDDYVMNISVDQFLADLRARRK
ncbi:MAG: PHP domain-containing protein [Clostridia bacterium]|nr:PHP domain-containing protein [Clostridia bacterium]